MNTQITEVDNIQTIVVKNAQTITFEYKPPIVENEIIIFGSNASVNEEEEELNL